MEKCTISTILCIFARKWPSQMSRKITTLAPALLRVHAPQSNDIYASEDIAILRSLRPLMSSSAVELIHTPQYVELGRILLVTGGKAVHQINLVPFETQPGDVLVIPQNTYISLSSLSDDYEGQMISFDHLSVDFEKCVHLRLKEDDFRRIRHYVDLLWETVHSKFDRKSVEHLETALLYDLKHLHTDQSGSMLSGLSRSQLIFQRFMMPWDAKSRFLAASKHTQKRFACHRTIYRPSSSSKADEVSWTGSTPTQSFVHRCFSGIRICPSMRWLTGWISKARPSSAAFSSGRRGLRRESIETEEDRYPDKYEFTCLASLSGRQTSRHPRSSFPPFPPERPVHAGTCSRTRRYGSRSGSHRSGCCASRSKG